MLNSCCMFLDSLVNGATIFPNVGNPTRTWDGVRPFHVFRVYRVFDECKRISNGIKGFEGSINFVNGFMMYNYYI